MDGSASSGSGIPVWGSEDMGMRQRDLDANPLKQFEYWFKDALAADETLPEAMALATATLEGIPSVRMVLFKGIHENGFEFFTNLNSKKSQEMESNPYAATVFWWRKLKRQIRLEGLVEKLGFERAEEYFRTRPRGSQIGAWASRQSQPISGREELEKQVRAFEKKYPGGEIPCPPFWSGFRLVPSTIEFWQQGADRLHDRVRYKKTQDGSWMKERLAP
jgi:pyridoxamine 5'-phosphate oxidase